MSSHINQAVFERIERLQNRLEEQYVTISQDSIGSVARPFINAHCRDTLKMLRDLYLQAYQVLDDFHDRDWFKDISESLKEFLETFPNPSGISSLGNASSSLKSIVTYPGVSAVIALTGIGAIWAEIKDICICYVMVALAVYGIPWIIHSVVNGFRKKRNIFLTQGVYKLEDELLSLLYIMRPRPAKRRMIQYDVVGWFLCAVIGFIATVTTEDHRNPSEFRHPLLVGGIWYILAAASIALFVVAMGTLVSSRRRPWAWYASKENKSEE